MTYKYRLIPKHMPIDAEFLSLGSVYKYTEPEITANNNVYHCAPLIGVFISNIYSEKQRPYIEIISNEDLGDKIYCTYRVTNSKEIYYISGYVNTKMIDGIDVLYECIDKNKKYDVATRWLDGD